MELRLSFAGLSRFAEFPFLIGGLLPFIWLFASDFGDKVLALYRPFACLLDEVLIATHQFPSVVDDFSSSELMHQASDMST